MLFFQDIDYKWRGYKGVNDSNICARPQARIEESLRPGALVYEVDRWRYTFWHSAWRQEYSSGSESLGENRWKPRWLNLVLEACACGRLSGKIKAVNLEKLVVGMQIVSNLVRSGLSSHESRPLSTIYLLSQDEPVFIRRSISGFLVMAARKQK
ncbi:hypothetical protein CISG_10278 [Coccidioides immitis RMSCC 3703]|uniref:Uncharacterized protein n=2 Tax=Coccidioides immitis TaxID=5501 RepID=A0A0J8QNZ3_COCIT|nr:hypothetical protein CIRG_04452 [Coccidioides immitis RMSCC 2394]KMU74181.1 hypothetical protein CISG_10278 [Coccidioides immitis RMSCC 3703]